MRRSRFAVALVAAILVFPGHAVAGHGGHHRPAVKVARCPYGPAPTLVATPTPPCRVLPRP